MKYGLAFPALFLASMLHASAPQVRYGAEPAVIIAGQQISLGDAIEQVITQNKDITAAAYEVSMADSQLKQMQALYSLRLQANAKRSYRELPGSQALLGGDSSFGTSWDVSMAKYFSSGTLLTAGYSHEFGDVRFSPNSPIAAFSASGISFVESRYHQGAAFVGLRQELLRNAFGMDDRRREAMLANMAEAQKETAIYGLSGLVVKTIADYWAVLVAAQKLANAEKNAKETADLLKTITVNVNLGTADSFQLHFYKALNAASQIAVETARMEHSRRLRAFLSLLGIQDAGDAVKEVVLADRAEPGDLAQLKEKALKERADMKAARLALESAKFNLKVARSQDWPSLTAGAAVSSLGRRGEAEDALKDLGKLEFPVYEVTLSLSMPLFDATRHVAVRDARFRVRQAEINLENTQSKVADDVTDRFEAVVALGRVAGLARQAREEAEKAYEGMVRRLKTGSLSTAIVKDGLDGVIQARAGELEAQVGYNLSILALDVAANRLWTRFGIDVEAHIPTLEDLEK